MVGELKNPLLYKNIDIPIIGPIPNKKSTNFAEFFVEYHHIQYFSTHRQMTLQSCQHCHKVYLS